MHVYKCWNTADQFLFIESGHMRTISASEKKRNLTISFNGRDFSYDLKWQIKTDQAHHFELFMSFGQQSVVRNQRYQVTLCQMHTANVQHSVWALNCM